MVTNTQDAGNAIDAGLYLRARKQIRSRSWPWGRSWIWNKKKLPEVSEPEMERPWAGLAEWLRVAHSLLDEKAAM